MSQRRRQYDEGSQDYDGSSGDNSKDDDDKSDRGDVEDDKKRRHDKDDARCDDDRWSREDRRDGSWDKRKDDNWPGRSFREDKWGNRNRDDIYNDRNSRESSWNDRNSREDRRDNWNDRKDSWNSKRRDDTWESNRRDKRESSREDDDETDDRKGRDRSRDRRYRRSPDQREWRDRGRRRWSPGSRRSSPSSDSFPDPDRHLMGEWVCKCGAFNFKRRLNCYRQHCNAPRSDAISVYSGDKPSINPKRHPSAPVPPIQSYTLEDVPRLAAYSAQMYATNPLEQASYLKFYTNYYTQQLSQKPSPLSQATSELDKVNAAAAVAQSAISQLQARNPVTAPPTGTDNRMYPVPDVSTYLYDETSGYYYDPTTGLYYDSNTQYYFNNQTNQYLYWDVTRYTYVLASTLQNAGQATVPPVPPVAPSISTTETPQDEKKKPGEKTDKVKVAKKIAKDMERWAKTLNQKKEMARSISVAEATGSGAGSSSGSADIGFSVLEQRTPVNSAPAVQAPPPILVPSYGAGSDSSGDESEENIIDWNKLACLLCKRQFPSKDVLEKHQLMSDLHKQNLEMLKGPKSKGEKKDNTTYRDRAAERRLKYGEDDTPIVRAPRLEPIVSSLPQEIGEENIGNKLLKKMGWSAGQGLGKDGQGIIGPVEATGGGLGKKRGIYTAGPGETYRGCVKKLTMARYQDLVGSEGKT